jgi:hypothetical protein
MTDFRPCLICLSYSQASLYHCILQLIICQFELTFVHLRYSLGGDRPSQTTNHTLFIIKIILVIYFNKSGISLLFKQFTSVKVLTIPTYSIHIK